VTIDNGNVFFTGKVNYAQTILREQLSAAGSPGNPPANPNDNVYSFSVSAGFGPGGSVGVKYDAASKSVTVSGGFYAVWGGEGKLSFDFSKGFWNGISHPTGEYSVGAGAIASLKLGFMGKSIGFTGKLELGLHSDANGVYVGPQVSGDVTFFQLATGHADYRAGVRLFSQPNSNRSYVHDLNPTPSYPWVGGLASPLGLTKSSETMNIPPYKDVSFSVDTVSWMDPSTGVSKAVHSVVSLNNSANAPTGTRYDGLRGNVYSPGNINVGQELNALDQIAREQALGLLARPSGNQTAVSPTPAPSLPTGPNGITPSLPGANVSSTPSGQYHSTSHYANIGKGGMVTGLPVVLDLNGNGVEISLSTKAAFDYDGDGFREPTAWVAPGDGFLVIDLNADGTRGAGDGKIDQAKELVLSMWGPAGSTDLQAVDGNNAGLMLAA